ncbi:MAG: TonB-dependent receptor [Maribacter sp.]|nr:MAG: TonB-dependent receptor [Maribacter sp.]
MILNKNIFLVYFSIILGTICFGQEKVSMDSTKTEELKEVIVTATRTTRQLSSLPLPVNIVTKREIENVNSLRLNDILNEQTGLIMVPDHGEGVQMQGLDSDYTLILVDGAPLVGRTAGTLDLSRVTIGNIKQIEIVKGASSSLYGSEALAGVINIITKNPEQGFSGNIGLRMGTFNTTDANASVNYKKKKLGINVFANRYSSDGYDLDKSDDLQTFDPYHNYTFNAKVSYDFSESTGLYVSGRYYTENQKNIPKEALKGEADINEWNTHVKLNHKHNEKWDSYVDFYATRYERDSYLNNLDNTPYSESDYNQLLVRPEMRLAYNPTKKHSFIGGIGWTHETLTRTYFSNSPKFDAPYVYVQYDTNPTDKSNLILGARFDHHSEYESQLSPKAALRYALNDKIAIKGSVGYGYKAPDFRQLYLDFTNPTVGYTVIGHNLVPKRLPELQNEGQIINILMPTSEFGESLKPENSFSFNTGLQLRPTTAVTVDINLFRNNIKDLIDTQIIARKTNGQNVLSYKNISNVYTQGLEFNTSWKPSNYLRVSGGYQLLLAKDKDAEKAFGNGEVYARKDPGSPSFQLKKDDYFGLFNRSRHMANAKVFYTLPKGKLNTNIRATYRSKYGLRDANSNGYLDNYDKFVGGYAIVDFAINKTFYKNYQLGLGIDNLFGFTDPQNISNISGRLIYGKLNIQF